MEFLGIARIILLILAIIAFFYLARRLKGILLPALILIGTGFGLIMLDLILRSIFGAGFLFESLSKQTPPLIGTTVSFIGQIAGIILLLLGFYHVNRVVVDITERQRMEDERRIIGEALAESERRYRRFFEEDLSGNFISTPEGRILVCNPSFARIFGYDSPAELQGLSVSAFHESPRERMTILELLKQKRRLINYKQKGHRKDGTPVYITSNIHGEFNEVDELVRIQGYVVDETERVRAEQSLRESTEQLRKVFEEGPVGMTVFNLNWDVIRANEAFCRMVGYSEDELKTIALRGLTHPDDAEMDEAQIRELLSGEIPSHRSERRYITKSGDIIWGLVTMSVVHEGDGTPLYGIGIIEDITARKKGEQELEQSLSLLRATLESTADGILVVNDRGRIVVHNQKFVDMWGIPESAFSSRDDRQVLFMVLEQLEDPDGFVQNINGLLAQPE